MPGDLRRCLVCRPVRSVFLRARAVAVDGERRGPPRAAADLAERFDRLDFPHLEQPGWDDEARAP